jgi:ABC-2 type transport system permease protein
MNVRAALVILLKDLRHRLRDRTAVLAGIVIPLGLSAIVGFALGRLDSGVRARVALVDLDGGDASRALADSLRSGWPERTLELEEVASTADADARMARETVQAVLVVPAGFGASLRTPTPLSLSVRSSPDAPLAGLLTRALAARFAARLDAPEAPAILEPRSPGGQLRPIDHYGPSLAVLFLFFSVVGGLGSLQAEASSGTLARLAATPVGPRAVLAGKLGALVLLGLLQFTVLALATAFLFGVRWGPLLPVATLGLTTVCSAVGVMAFLVTVTGDPARGSLLAMVTLFVLSLLGGQFLPPQGLPDIFDWLARLTPNGQALRGFADLASAGPGAGLAVAAEPLLFTAVSGVAGIVYCARRLGRPQTPRT